jgi:predicted glycosyltransferase
MRDIPSPPGERFKLSGELGEVRKHAALYDRLMFAGDARFFDAAQSYAWPPDVQAKMKYLGFVVPPVEARPRAEALAPYPQLDPARPMAIVSFGGGWQAEQFAAQFIEGLRLRREQGDDKGLQMIMAVGPAVGAEHLEMLRERAEELGGIVVEHFTHHFAQVLQSADFAILQAGSATFQVLETDIPVLLTHRPYKSREQEERARRLAQWPGIRLEPCEPMAAATCAEWIEWGLTQPHTPRQTGFSFRGIENAAREVLEGLHA